MISKQVTIQEAENEQLRKDLATFHASMSEMRNEKTLEYLITTYEQVVDLLNRKDLHVLFTSWVRDKDGTFHLKVLVRAESA